MADGLSNTYIRYIYDLAGRVREQRTYAGTALTGRTRLSTVSYTYEDKTNRVIDVTYRSALGEQKTTYSYGAMAQSQMPDAVYSLSTGNQQQVSYAYDSLGRLTGRTLTVPNQTTAYTYVSGIGGDANRTTGQVHTVTANGVTTTYAYDAVGNIVDVTRSDGSGESYDYDELNQLIEAEINGVTYTYQYDDRGNLLQKTVGTETDTYGYTDSTWADLLTSFNGQTITYDAIGNPLGYRNGMTMTWQQGRKLAGVTQNGNTVTYAYDASGARLSKTVNGSKTEEYRVDGVLYGQKNPDDKLLMLLKDESGANFGFTYDGNTYYYLTNLQGDVTGIVDSTGTQVVSYTYDPYGKPLAVTGSMADTIGAVNPLRYRGYYYDAETGFYYVSSRYYDPEIGRWTNADSLIDNRGVITQNLFQYCGNNPVNNADPSGNLFGAIVGIGLLVIGMVATLSGCSSTPAATTSSPSTPSKSSTPSSSTSSTTPPQIPTPQEKSYAATVYAEAGGQNRRSKQAVAHVMNNRIGTRPSWTDIEAVISAKYQFDGYNNPMYKAAMNYYDNGICNNSIEQAAMDECLDVVIPIYRGVEADITSVLVL